MKEEKEIKKCPIPLWKRAGYIGFWFFFFKGIAWLVGLFVVYIWGPSVFTNIKQFVINIFT
jgi:hypothetical protein